MQQRFHCVPVSGKYQTLTRSIYSKVKPVDRVDFDPEDVAAGKSSEKAGATYWASSKSGRLLV